MRALRGVRARARLRLRGRALGLGGGEHAGPLPHGVPYGAVERSRVDDAQHGQQIRVDDGVLHALRRHGGAFAPMGGIYKTDVYALARWRNERALERGDVAPIPENVLLKAPSAELSLDQSDEGSLGIDYATLDRILIEHVERGRSVDQLVEEGFDRDQVEDVVVRAASYSFKRALEPPYPTEAFYA